MPLLMAMEMRSDIGPAWQGVPCGGGCGAHLCPHAPGQPGRANHHHTAVQPTLRIRLRRRALAGPLALACSLAVLTPAGAAPRPEGPTAATAVAATLALAQPSPALPGLPSVSVELATVAVDSAAFRRARASYEGAAGALAERQAQRVALDRSLTEVRGQVARVQAELTAARARRASVAARLDDVSDAIADLGVALFLSGGGAARIDAALTADQPSINDTDRRHVLGDASLDVLLAEQRAYKIRFDDAQARIDEAVALLAELEARQADLRAARPEAAHAEAISAPDVAEERVAYEEARVLAPVTGVEFPLVALDAYYRAARSSEREDPACGVRWWAIAGISRVEGHHGTYGGAALDAKGDATKRIIGIQLNGTRYTRVPSATPTVALSTATPSTTVPSARCSSYRRRGRGSRPTATATARPPPSTSMTPPSLQPATSAGPARGCRTSRAFARPTSPTTTPWTTWSECCPSPASTSTPSRSPTGLIDPGAGLARAVRGIWPGTS